LIPWYGPIRGRNHSKFLSFADSTGDGRVDQSTQMVEQDVRVNERKRLATARRPVGRARLRNRRLPPENLL